MNHGLIIGGVVDYHYVSVKRAPGAHKIATHLRRQGWDVEVLDFVQSWTLEELKEFSRQRVTNKTKFLGISATFSVRFKHLYEFLPWFKEQYPDVIIVSGSQSFYNCEGLPIDYMVTGYGEHAMDAILNGTVKGEEHKWLNGNKFIRVDATKHHPAAQMKNLSSHYEERDYIQPQEVLTVEFGRGCIFNCHFCTLTHRNIKDDHSRSADNLYTELLENYEKWGVTNYSIADETVNDYTEKLYRYSNEIKKLPFKPNMAGYIRADLLISKPNDWEMISDIGLNSQFYGIESFNRPSAKSVGKGMETIRLQDGLLKYKDWMEARGFYRGHLSLIAGLPHETLDTLRATKQWIETNWQGQSSMINPLWIPDITRPYEEKSRFAEDPEKYGYTITTLGDKEWTQGPQGRFTGLFKALQAMEAPEYERKYKEEEATFQEEMAFMNWKNKDMELYDALKYLELEWYDESDIHKNQPPLPFTYHNWLIDTKYTWDDMKLPQDSLQLPEDSAQKFINQYKQYKLNSSS